MISIIALLIALLLPAIKRARNAVHMVRCQATLRQLHLGLISYSMDYEGYTPEEPPHNGADWTPDDGRSVAGNQIWGLTRPGSSNTNVALGLGQLVEGGYNSVAGLFCSTQGYPLRAVGRFFGEPYQQPWSHPETGVPWSPWWGGANYFMKGSYAYRSNDWSTPFKERRDIEHLRPEHDEYNQHVVAMDSRASFHEEIGCNVVWGDGSVMWWGDDETLTYTIPWQGATYPTSGQWHSSFLTHLMHMADQYAH